VRIVADRRFTRIPVISHCRALRQLKYSAALTDYRQRRFVSNYYDRYRRGERIEVWSDLIALGDIVRQEPVYADAVAVARETMTRARENVETLITRLDGIGYEFLTPKRAMQGLAAHLEGMQARCQATGGASHEPVHRIRIARGPTAWLHQESVRACRRADREFSAHAAVDRVDESREIRGEPSEFARRREHLHTLRQPRGGIRGR
jgi:hypothetical protein